MAAVADKNPHFVKYRRRPPTPPGAHFEPGDDVNRPANDPNRSLPEEIELRAWQEGDATGKEGDFVTKDGTRVLTAGQVEAFYASTQTNPPEVKSAAPQGHQTHSRSGRE